MNIQELLTHYNNQGYSDAKLAEFTGLSQPGINAIRTGRSSGVRKTENFFDLFEQYKQESGNHTAILDMPQKETRVRTSGNTTRKTRIQTSKEDDTTEEINDKIFGVKWYIPTFGVPVLIAGIFIAFLRKLKGE